MSQQKKQLTKSTMYSSLRYILKAIRCCASYILVSRLGLGINFIQWIAVRSSNDTQFVAVALFAVTTGPSPKLTNFSGGGKNQQKKSADLHAALGIIFMQWILLRSETQFAAVSEFVVTILWIVNNWPV